MGGELYQRSDGGYCSAVQLWEHFESGEWAPCTPRENERPIVGDPRTEWVRTRDGERITLTPIDRNELPETVTVESTDEGVIVVEDTPTQIP